MAKAADGGPRYVTHRFSIRQARATLRVMQAALKNPEEPDVDALSSAASYLAETIAYRDAWESRQTPENADRLKGRFACKASTD